MNLATDRALIPADTQAVRFLTVTLTAPKAARTSTRPALAAIERIASELERREEEFGVEMSSMAMKSVHDEAANSRRGRDTSGKARRIS